MTWLDTLQSQHSELESPMTFWFWSGMATISAVVKDNVWMDRQVYNLYPNIYVMLHAESGLKKGPPISMAKQLVRAVNNTRLISGRSSIQGILKELGTGETKPGGKINAKSHAFICSSELTSSLVGDKVATDILTDLFDRQYNVGEWRSLLKMEQFNLVDPTITMLTATNEAHSNDFFERKDIHGGFFARTFLVAETQKNRSNSLLVPLTNPPNYKALIDYLKQLSNLKGAFKPLAEKEQSEEYPHEHPDRETGELAYFSQAGIAYQIWYEEFSDAMQVQEVKDETGTLNRFGDSVLKVAMLLSLSRSPELYIDEDSMHRAIEHCKRLLGNIRELTHGREGLSEAKSLKDLIIKELMRREQHQITRALLLRKMWAHYKNVSEMDDIMHAFEQAGQITIENRGTAMLYILPASEVAKYKEQWDKK